MLVPGITTHQPDGLGQDESHPCLLYTSELGKDSFSFTMVVDADDAPQKVAQVVQEQLQTTLPGFTLELKVEPKKQRVQDMQDGNFEIGLTR